MTGLDDGVYMNHSVDNGLNNDDDNSSAEDSTVAVVVGGGGEFC